MMSNDVAYKASGFRKIATPNQSFGMKTNTSCRRCSALLASSRAPAKKMAINE